MKYKAHIPPTHSMPPADYIVSDKTMETKEEEALWHYNRSREHDCFAPLTSLPRGTTFTPEPEPEAAAFNRQFEEWKGDSDGTVGVD